MLKQKNCNIVDGFKSNVIEIEADVPQGSRLGPLLWIVYSQAILEDLNLSVCYLQMTLAYLPL